MGQPHCLEFHSHRPKTGRVGQPRCKSTVKRPALCFCSSRAPHINFCGRIVGLFIMSTAPTVLIVDDDPSHLKLYSWIVQRGGFQAVVALVGSRTVEYPKDRQVDIVALDYRLASTLTAPQIAGELRQLFPDAPIIVLSELSWMPAEMEPYAKAFVSKGEPQELLDLIAQLTGHPVKRRP